MNIPPLHHRLTGAGLGLRRSFIDALNDYDLKESKLQFFEIAPENWIDMGGIYAKNLRRYTEQYPFACHGLSLSLGGTQTLNQDLLHKIKSFMRSHQINFYSEHLSYTGDKGQLYELLPLPFNTETIRHVSKRIEQTQDILGHPIAIENASFYLPPQGQDLSELEFTTAVLEEANCYLHLDVNNVYVNSQNHKCYDPKAFIQALPSERIAYLHVAGHAFREEASLLIDTHGETVKEDVWELLKHTYICHGVQPTLLERDSNIPALQALIAEVDYIHQLQTSIQTR